MLVKQNANGGLNSRKGKFQVMMHAFYPNRMPLNEMDTKSYLLRFLTQTPKTNFLIVDDVKNIVIYNINSKKD
jgi:hypothetical protein